MPSHFGSRQGRIGGRAVANLPCAFPAQADATWLLRFLQLRLSGSSVGGLVECGRAREPLTKPEHQPFVEIIEAPRRSGNFGHTFRARRLGDRKELRARLRPSGLSYDHDEKREMRLHRRGSLLRGANERWMPRERHCDNPSRKFHLLQAGTASGSAHARAKRTLAPWGGIRGW